MKCPKCGGTGEMQICEMGFIGKDECDKCHGKGYLTTEEWLRQANIEQLAEWIAHQTMMALLENQNNHSLRMTYPAYWVEWLKQPHTFE